MILILNISLCTHSCPCFMWFFMNLSFELIMKNIKKNNKTIVENGCCSSFL
ncbi:hypothetical protein IX321_002720 [Bacteroides pyogenes]|nr:hypothetical protein [Bacteroides pyogenes]MBR8718830.1 hypothetical protein [Bacteroides pyogenes]MBR8748304.1 hypothetical protein [Bacteroides pyogenes]MBR8758541.1 hypothetical protein [Bacteroides pyogenes]MBR8781777.1 hypothetical protein [Bacteroides pyogenes]